MARKKMTIKNTLGRKYRGLSLMELILYIFVMTLMLLASTASVASYMRGRNSIKKYQQDIEAMSLAMSDMSKTLRMSNTATGGGNGISVTKNDGGTATYGFSLNALSGAGSEMVNGVNGSFSIDNSNGPISLIKIVMWQVDSSGNIKAGTTMETSVSQRSGYEITSP